METRAEKVTVARATVVCATRCLRSRSHEAWWKEDYAMTTPHDPGTPHYPEAPDMMEARLIEEITQVQAHLGLDLLGPKSAIVLCAVSIEALSRQDGTLRHASDRTVSGVHAEVNGPERLHRRVHDQSSECVGTVAKAA